MISNKTVIRMMSIAMLAVAFSGCTRESDPEPRGMMRPGGAENPELAGRIEAATDAYRRFISEKGVNLTGKLQTEMGCIAVVPNFTNTALVVGTTSGQGIVSCKTHRGEWSAPAFFNMSSQSVGAQLGRSSSDIVMLVLGDEAARKFARGDTFTLGSEMDVTAIQTGAGGGVSMRRGVNTYAINKQGGFLGLSLSGSRITPDQKANSDYYGQNVTSEQILFQNAVQPPPHARRFMDSLRTA